jgi:hypothetical protein
MSTSETTEWIFNDEWTEAAAGEDPPDHAHGYIESRAAEGRWYWFALGKRGHAATKEQAKYSVEEALAGRPDGAA